MVSFVVMQGNGPFRATKWLVQDKIKTTKLVLLTHTDSYYEVYQGVIEVKGRRYIVQAIAPALTPKEDLIWTGVW
jgi:hypothetical protein